MKGNRRLIRTVSIAVMGAVAFVLQLFDFPLPLLPPFLKVDFSDVPAILSAIIFGPLAGIWVEGLKNLVHYVVTGSESGIPIGNISNFLAGSVLVFTTGFVYQRMMTLKGMLYGLGLGVALMTIVMAIANYFIFLPAYVYLLGWSLGKSEIFTLSIVVISAFNLIKGAILLVLMAPLYLRMRSFVTDRRSLQA